MRFRHLLVALLVLFVAPEAWSQCHPSSINFSETTDMYTDQPADQTAPSHIYRTIDMSGIATMTGSPCTGILHYARVYNNFNGVGGYQSGPQVCPSCFTEAQSTISAAFLEGDTIPSTDGADVNCSLAGRFVSLGFFGNIIEVAITKSVQTGQSTNYPKYWKLASWCTTLSTPPDWDPNAIAPLGGVVYPYYHSFNICERLNTAPAGTPWGCYTRSSYPLVYPEMDTTRATCTKHDASTHGVWVDTDYFKNAWQIIKTSLGL